MRTNKELFRDLLIEHYRDLFKNDPEYAYAAQHTTPEALADKMTNGLATGGASRDGEGIKRTCKQLGIKPTYKAIQRFFNQSV